MDYSADQLIGFMQQSEPVDDATRMKIFEFLSQRFSLIPVKGGFPAPGQSPREFKAPVENNWSQWCSQKRPFANSDFFPERAGIACGPASGVLVLDIDDMCKFQEWLAAHKLHELPATLTIKTGGTGERYHYYFQYPQDGKSYGNRSVRGVFDIRGQGGQVLCPGSLHPETWMPYVISNLAEIAEAPSWLLNYTLHKSVQADNAAPSLTNEATEVLIMTQSSATPQPSVQFVANLPVSDEIKQMILTPFPEGQRSEHSMAVLVGLLSANVDEKTILSIYHSYPIGEKAKEAGNQWLEREIEKAKEHIAKVKTSAPVPTNPFAPSGNQAPKVNYCVFNAMDVVNRNIQFDYFIDNFWPKGEPLLITGPGGSGKSIMTLQIAMDLISPPAQGFLSTFNVKPAPHKVLFVQSENTFVGMKQRFVEVRSAKSGYQISDQLLQDGIFFLGVNNDIRSIGDMMSQSFLDAIQNAVETHQTDIIILDPLISFHGQDENSNDQMRRLLDQVAVFTESLGASPLLIHHHGKFTSESGPGGGRGASAIGDWSPNTWELTYNKNQKRFTLTHKKARNLALQGSIDLELHHLRFRPLTSQSAASGSAQIAVQALQKLGGTATSKDQLKKEVQDLYSTHNTGKTISQNTAGKRIDEAVAAGLIKENPIQGSKSKGYSF